MVYFKAYSMKLLSLTKMSKFVIFNHALANVHMHMYLTNKLEYGDDKKFMHNTYHNCN